MRARPARACVAPMGHALAPMGRDPRHDILFEPVRIGPKTLRNRFYQVPHCTGFGVEKPWSQARTAPSRPRAAGRRSTPSTARSTPTPTRRRTSRRACGTRATCRCCAATCDEAHRHGALAGIELSHTGAHGENSESRLPAAAPSQIASDFATGLVPRAMTKRDIRRVQADWARAAERSRERRLRHRLRLRRAHLPAGPVPLAALQPAHRRVRRLAREPRALLARDARGACATPSATTARSPAASRSTAWARSASSSRRASSSCAWPTISSTSGTSTSARSPSGRRTRGRRASSPRAGSSSAPARVREATAKPIVGVGRLTDPDLMAEIVRSGVWDLIGAARPSIADPFLPRKIDEGRVDEIRECIGCNVCISKADTRRHIGCTQNATAGEEHRRGWHPERFAPLPTRPRRARGRRRAGRHGVRPRRSRAAAPSACASSTARRRWAATSAGSRACPGSREWGRRDGLPDGGAQAPAERRARSTTAS